LKIVIPIDNPLIDVGPQNVRQLDDQLAPIELAEYLPRLLQLRIEFYP
jgi:hypothetical protein